MAKKKTAKKKVSKKKAVGKKPNPANKKKVEKAIEKEATTRSKAREFAAKQAEAFNKRFHR